MSEDQKYTEKEDRKDSMMESIRQYFSAAEQYGMSEFEMRQEITDALEGLGKTWTVSEY